MNIFQEELSSFVENNDLPGASDIVMSELGNIVANKKADFVYLLNSSGVPANLSMSEQELIEIYSKNVGGNKKLLIGSAYLINHHNKTMGADGSSEVDDLGVKRTYDVLYANFSDADGGAVTAIAQGVGEIAKFGQGALAQSRGARKTQAASAKQTMLQTALEQKAKKSEEGSKTTKYVIIGAISLVAIIAIGLVVYKLKKK
jgi:hypothetical protein